MNGSTAGVSVYVHVSDEKIRRTHRNAGGTVNVDVDESGVPVGVEVLGAFRVDIDGRPATPIPGLPQGDAVDKVSQALRGYRIHLGSNTLALIKQDLWSSVPLSPGEMRDIAWLLQEAGLLNGHPPRDAAKENPQ